MRQLGSREWPGTDQEINPVGICLCYCFKANAFLDYDTIESMMILTIGKYHSIITGSR